MTSEIKADKWSPASGTAGTIGDSGDTFTVPSGVTLNTSSATLSIPSTVITSQTEKSSLVDADKFLISDSAASGALKYVQKSNLPSGAWTLLETETITGSTPSDVDISNFDSSYNIHAIAFDSVGSSSDNDTFRQSFSSDGGSNFNVQGYGAGFGHRVNQSNTVTTDNFGTSAAGALKLAEGIGGDSDEGLSGLIYYTGLKDTARQTYYWGNTMIENDSSNYINYVILGKLTTVDIDAIRFNFNAGTFDMGIIKLFGIK